MSAKFFLDTNILVYSFDTDTPAKCLQARNLISNALESGLGVISFQVVQEFINFALRTKTKPMTLEQARRYFVKILQPLTEIQSSNNLYHKALAIKERTKFSWYDSVIVAGACEAKCEILYSEDMQHNRKIDGLEIRNPFR